MMILLSFVTILCIGNLIAAARVQSADNFGFGIELILAKLETLEARMMDLEKFNHHLNDTLHALNSSCFASLKSQELPRIPATGGLPPKGFRHLPYETATHKTSNETGNYYSYSSCTNYTTEYGGKDDLSNIRRQSYQQTTPLHLPDRSHPSRSYREHRQRLESRLATQSGIS